MKRFHSKKMLRSKSSASRGKQATGHNTAEFGFRRAIQVALLSSYGIGFKAQARCASISSFVERRVAALKLRPRSFLKEFKSHVTTVRLNTVQGKVTDRSILGQILPRVFSRQKTTRAEVLLQYTRIGRALPKVPVIPADLKDQVERMSLPHMTNVPDEIREVLERIEWPDPAKAESIPSDFISTSSCLEATRKEGGRTSLMKGNPLFLFLSLVPVKSARSGLTRVDRSAAEFSQLMLNSKEYSADTNCKPLAIPELGAKVRIVTKHHSALVALSHRSRRLLWPLLTRERNISVSDSISDPVLGTIEFPRKRRDMETYQVFSADLSAATDYLGWPVIQLICQLAQIPFDHVCPSKIDGVTIYRGTAMGLPASWPVLSLAHYAVCAAVDPSHSFRIKGDDLIALWSAEEIERYYELSSSIGFVPNRAKSALDRRRGIFCEVSYLRKGQILYRQPDFSIRSFVKNEPLSEEQWIMLESYGADQKILHQLARESHTSWVSMCHKARINPWMPRRMGGLGLPPRKMDMKLSRRDSRTVNIVHNGLLPTLIEQKPMSACLKIYSDFIRSNIFWTCQGGSHLKDHIFREHSGKFLFRAAFMDAIGGKVSHKIMKHRDTVRQIGDLLKRIRMQKQGHAYPTTYGEAYSLIDRLMISRESPVFELGASYWKENCPVPEWELQELVDRYDEEASKRCSPENHFRSMCTVRYKEILGKITQR